MSHTGGCVIQMTAPRKSLPAIFMPVMSVGDQLCLLQARRFEIGIAQHGAFEAREVQHRALHGGAGKSASCNCAPVRSAPCSEALRKLTPCACTPPVRSAFSRCALDRLAPVSSELDRSAPSSCASSSLAPRRSTPHSRALPSWARVRSTPLAEAHLPADAVVAEHDEVGLGAAERGVLQVGADEAGAVEAGAGEIGAAQVGTVELGVAQVTAAQAQRFLAALAIGLQIASVTTRLRRKTPNSVPSAAALMNGSEKPPCCTLPGSLGDDHAISFWPTRSSGSPGTVAAKNDR